MLNELEKSQIRGLIYSPQWKTIEKIAELFIQKARGESTVNGTQWEMMRDTLLGQGKAQGVEQFFQELLNQSKDSK
ncbi:MAG: hypothetical protein AAB875_02520 [Patescibacteria group bacterium]